MPVSKTKLDVAKQPAQEQENDQYYLLNADNQPLSDEELALVVKDAKAYIVKLAASKHLTEELESEKQELKSFLLEEGVQDEKGSYCLNIKSNPDKATIFLKAQAKTSRSFKAEAITMLLDKYPAFAKSLVKEKVETTQYIDEDVLTRLVTDELIDEEFALSLIASQTTYAFQAPKIVDDK